MTIAYINGEYLPLEEATISPMDRGFLFGDAVYEVIPVFGGKPFRLEQHLQRLESSLAAIQLNSAINIQNLKNIIGELIAQSPTIQEQSIYLQISRGSYPNRDHLMPVEINPTIFAYCTVIKSRAIADLAKGLTAVTLQDIRWLRCDIKSTTLLANVLLRRWAIELGADEALLVRDNLVLEGTASNLFMIKHNKIFTPMLSQWILGGITRDLIIELAQKENIPLVEGNISLEELESAEEIWLSSSTREIVPVLKLNNRPVGKGKAGEIWYKMIQSYQDYKNRLIHGL